MRNFLVRNLRVFITIGLLTAIGYCFGGKIGVGIALTIVLISQFL